MVPLKIPNIAVGCNRIFFSVVCLVRYLITYSCSGHSSLKPWFGQVTNIQLLVAKNIDIGREGTQETSVVGSLATTKGFTLGLGTKAQIWPFGHRSRNGLRTDREGLCHGSLKD